MKFPFSNVIVNYHNLVNTVLIEEIDRRRPIILPDDIRALILAYEEEMIIPTCWDILYAYEMRLSNYQSPRQRALVS